MKKNLMKKAHQMTKEIVEKYGDVDYKTQLGLCLSFLSEDKEEEKMVELKGSEKQIKWAEDLRRYHIVYQNQVKEMILDEIGVTEGIEECLDEFGFETVEEAFNVIRNIESASVIIEEFKGRNEKSAESSKRAIESSLYKCENWLTKEAALREKELWVENIICTAAYLRDDEAELKRRGRI